MLKKNRLASLSLAILITASLFCNTAHAVLDDYIEKFANNDIIFYNPEECGSSASNGLYGNNVKEKIWNYFHDKGLSDAQVAGVVANAYKESSFIVTAASNANYWGIFQFSRDIAKNLFDNIKSAGYSKFLDKEYWSNDDKVDKESPGAVDNILKIILDYSWNDWYKKRTGYGDWRKTIKESAEKAPNHEPEWAAEVFVRDFEGAEEKNQTGEKYENQYYHPGTRWQGVGDRRKMARTYYNEMKDKITTVGTGATVEECCDPNGDKATYTRFPGKTYTLSKAQISAIAQYALAKAGTSTKTHAMSVLSFHLNKFEKEKGTDQDTMAMIHYLATSIGGADVDDEKINKSTFTNSTLTKSVESVIVQGDRILPPQIVVSVKYNGAKATNNGTNVSTSPKKYLRGITKVTNGDKTIIFWDWAYPGKKSKDIYGYTEDYKPSESVLAQSIGTSNGKSSSGAIWKDGWIKSGINGYKKDAVSSSTYPSINPRFGLSYSTDSAKGSGKGPNKITLIATESSSAGKKASSLYKKSKGYSSPPHFTVDMKNGKVYQHGSIYNTASAVSGDHNSESGIQIAIVGYAKSSKKSNSNYLGTKSNFTDLNYKYLYNLINAISIETGIPFSSSVDWSSSSVLSSSKIKSYKGVLGRKHVDSSDSSSIPKAFWDKLLATKTAVVEENSQVCPSKNSSGDVNALQSLIQKVAYPDYSGTIRGEGSAKQEYKDLLKKGVWYKGGCGGNDCGGFVTTMMRESGWDKGYNPNRVGTWGHGKGQMPYLRDSSKWEDVTAQIKSNKDAKPGDVLIYKSHTLLYAGKIPGFTSELVSASWSKKCAHSRPPMADKAKNIMNYINHKKNDYHVYRKVQ